VRFLRHIAVHKRLPRPNSGLFNDWLYYLHASGELQSPLRQRISDKETVKDYIASKIGDQYNVPTLAVLRSYGEAISYGYPYRCVIKPTHSSGRVIIRQGGEPIDHFVLQEWFDHDYYTSARETNYKSLPRKVIVEPIIFNDPNVEDFKFFCIKGVPKLIQVDFDRHTKHTRSFYSPEWCKQVFGLNYPIGPNQEKPANLLAMLDITARLSAEFDLLRVDLYSDGKIVFVGELTNFPEAGYGRFFPGDAERVASKIMFDPPSSGLVT